jgi:hypothetical protein
MMKLAVNVYTYSSDKSFSLNLAGYNYGTGTWYNTEANLIGSTAADNRVRFGYDSTLGKCCIYIGEPTSSWSYPKVMVKDFIAGYSNFARSQWESGWAIDIVTSAPQNVTQDYADALIDAASIRNQGALATTNSANWSSQVTGTGKPADNADVTNYSDNRVANSLLLANSGFNLITDDSLSNPSWWGFGGNTLPSYVSAVTATSSDQPVRFYTITAGIGQFDWSSTRFSVANSTQYRIKLSMFISSDFVGFVGPVVHVPGVVWALPGNTVTDPNGVFPNGHTATSWGSGSWQTREIIVTTSAQADLNWLQTRIYGRVSAGYFAFSIEVTSLFGGAGQINSTNASTFIDNAAIGNAQIDRATVNKLVVTNADIDRASVNKLQVVTADIVDANVSTLKIAGNAVSFAVSTSALEVAVTTDTVVLSLTFSCTGLPVNISYGGTFNSWLYYGSSSVGWSELYSIYLYRDSTLLSQFDLIADARAGVYRDDPGVGTFTYTLRCSRTYYSTSTSNRKTIKNPYLMAMEIKR